MINFDIPDATNISCVADWIEFLIAYEHTSISKSAVASKIEGAMGEEPNDTFLTSLWDELEVRMILYGDQPPFICNKMEVISNINWTANPEYLMCLILALTGNSFDPTPSGKLFERISMEAAKHYINGSAIIFGHPKLLSILEICRLTNERFKSELPSNYKDRGLDVVAWKPFDDNRGNQIFSCWSNTSFILKSLLCSR